MLAPTVPALRCASRRAAGGRARGAGPGPTPGAAGASRAGDTSARILSWRVADFAFATCLPGLEPALKLDVARARPELRLAYSRPGLVTFKSTRAVPPEDTPGSVFARVWGRSIGAASDPA